MSAPFRPGLRADAAAALSRMHGRANRFLRTVTGCMLTAVLLAGCGGATDLDASVAGQFQMRVTAAKQLAAEQNFTGAAAELDQLSGEVQLGVEQRTVSEQRRSRIEASISKVRADLEAAEAAARPDPGPTPAPSPEPSPDEREEEKDRKEEEGGDEDGNKGKGKGE